MQRSGHYETSTSHDERTVGPRQPRQAGDRDDTPTAGGIPVREVLALPALAGVRVVAGASGLDRLVRSVNVMEVPDILAWVRPGELLLTTAYPLRDDRAAIGELVPRLAERGLAGLAIKPARYIEAIPAELVSDADRLGFPLLELPPETSFNDLINGVLTVILNRQAARLQRSAEIHDRFTRIVLGGGGLRHIAQALADAIGRPAFLLDPQGTLLGRSVAPGVPIPAWPPDPSVEDPGRTVQPIRVGGELYGEIVVLAAESELGDDERDALEYAATVAALRQVQARAVAEADHRFQAVCLEELIAGQVVDRSVLTERAAAFGWDLQVTRAVLLATFGDSPAGQAPEAASRRHRLAEAARAALGRDAIVWERSEGIGALVADGPSGGATLRVAAGELQVEARRRLADAAVAIGLGRPVDDPLELPRSHVEAGEALRIGRATRGPTSIALFEELGLDRLLATGPERERLSFVETTLGPLLDHDERHGTNLMDTLDAYLSHRNVARAARDLYLHYNTLANRLDRIEELIGPFRDDGDRCLALALALRIRRFGP